jgi:long-chain acyl-CoA synthetase
MEHNYARYGMEGVRKYGEYVSFIYEEENLRVEFTNLQIQKKADALANALRDLGVRAGDVVAVVLPNGPAVPLVFTAIFKMGAVFLPVIFALTAAEIRYILEDSGANTVITEESLVPKVEEARRGLSQIRSLIVTNPGGPVSRGLSLEEILGKYPDAFPMHPVREEDLAVLMYTSGTTGSPKGVMLSHGNLSSNVEAGAIAIPTVHTDTMLIPLPLNHIFGLLMVNECNLSGARMILHKWFDPQLALRSITRNRVSEFVGVPTMYIRLMDAFDPHLHSMESIRQFLSGGAPLSAETQLAVEAKWGKPFYQGYGLTECSPTVSRQRVGRPRKPGCVGPAIGGVEIRILDEEDRELPRGEAGEVCVRGPNVMKGYFNKEEATREAMRKGWLHTGDVGYLDPEEELFITDRKKDLIIRGGENISPGAVEDILFKHPAVLEAAVVGIPDPVYGEEVKAYVVLKQGTQASEKDLLEHCLKHIPRYKAPKSIGFLKELPKNSVGKILKRTLRDMGKMQ